MVVIKGFKFDYLYNYKKPNLAITTLDKTKKIGILTPSNYSGLNLSLRFNAYSELSFNIVDKTTDMSETIEFDLYKKIKKNTLVLLPDIGWFVVNSTQETTYKDYKEKSVSCMSYETILNNKTVNLLDGTYKFYNELNPADEETLLGKLMQVMPNWKIGYVDSDLWNKYRTFEVPDSTIYSFLMNEVSEAYGCIFKFDTFTNTINAYTSKTAVIETDIIFSFSNLLQTIEIEETDSEIVTALGVYGSGDLDIRTINPLGTAMIYNFSYYYDVMSEDLKNAIVLWQEKINSNIETYGNLLASFKTQNEQLIVLKTELVDLQSELKAIDQIRTVQMPNVEASTTNDYNAKLVEINAKQAQITAKENEVKNIDTQMDTINSSLSFENSFTTEQLLELDNYILEGVYRNENYIQTTEMSSVDIQNMAEQLYEQGLEQSNTSSQPTYNFTMNLDNFLFMKEYEPFIGSIELGSTVHVEQRKGEWLLPICLEINIDYDNPDSFSIVFGNRFKLTTAQWTAAELQGKADSSLSKVNISSSLWGEPAKSGIIDEVSNYMNNSLDLAKQDIVNNNDSEVIFGEFGIRLREKLDTGDYSDIQTWLYPKGMAFTTNNWQTADAFLGTIENESGGYSTGLIADKIVGKLLAGNELIITNENNSFTLDGSGATLTNASFTLTTTDELNKIVLDPENGIKIQKKDGSSYIDTLWIDDEGNINTIGKITATSGNIGGFDITENTIQSENQNIILRNDGTAKIGNLDVGLTVSTFNGTIYANKLIGLAQDPVITGIYGSISATNAQVGSLQSDVANIGNLVATKASISDLSVTNASVSNLYADVAGIENLMATKASIVQLDAVDGKFENLNASNITAGTLSVNRMSSTVLTTNDLQVNGRIDAGYVSASGGAMYGGTLYGTNGEFSGNLTSSLTLASAISAGSIGCTTFSASHSILLQGSALGKRTISYMDGETAKTMQVVTWI